MTTKTRFHLLEATVGDIHEAFAAGDLSAKELVQLYLARIEAYDQQGPAINAIITLNENALAEAEALDEAYRANGGPTGPLHGIPILVKDQVDTVGMPTTLGSVLFKDYFPDSDGLAIKQVKEAGAIILGKVTLGELGGGDTHGTLFGSTRNPYDLERTVGGSSGGSGASANANFATLTIGQEGFASIRRPSAWNSCVGMRPTVGVVSRAGAYGGGPERQGSLGPITRTVLDAARLIDVMKGYDPEDPATAYAVGRMPESYAALLDARSLEGARIGIIRESIAANSEPDSDDFKQVTAVFDQAVEDLAAAGAVVVDPIVIPDINELLAKRAGAPGEANFLEWMLRSKNPPYPTMADLEKNPVYDEVWSRRSAGRPRVAPTAEAHYQYLLAREKLMANLLTVMADHQLDAIVHKTVEHTPTLIKDGVNPPYVNMKGVPHINTFLWDVPSITVPAGFTASGLPAGITFLGRSFTDADMMSFAYAYEQATHRRVPPTTTPPLPNEP
ncbi:MAG: amidase family protein [Dehalococcoidia bacterium]